MDTNPENQFDFWLGEWEAAWGENERGTNRVERILEGKIIQENFTAPDFTGMSVSAYDPERKLWCQTWVDSNGTYLDFTGSFENGRMILMRDAIVRGEACKQRMIWYDIEPITSTGTGSAQTMAEGHGACSGRSDTHGGRPE